MALIHNAEVVEKALSRLISFYDDKEKFRKFCEILMSPAQEIEDALRDLLLNRWISSAIGAQLDVLGRVVKLERAGYDDPEYRARLRARIRVLRSSGTADDIYAVFDLLFGLPMAITSGAYPPGDATPEYAGFVLWILGAIPASQVETTEQFLHATKGAAIRAQVVFWTDAFTPFEFGRGDFLTAGPLLGATTLTFASTAHFGDVGDTGSVRLGAGLADDETVTYTVTDATTLTTSALAFAHASGEWVFVVDALAGGFAPDDQSSGGGLTGVLI